MDGLGDVIAAGTKALGITPCDGCEARRKWLNEVFPFRRAQKVEEGYILTKADDMPSAPPELDAQLRRITGEAMKMLELGQAPSGTGSQEEGG